LAGKLSSVPWARGVEPETGCFDALGIANNADKTIKTLEAA
jgi:hypothetical protein